MAEERTREDVEWELEWEKRNKKFFLICSAVCAGIGLIIGIVMAITDSSPEYTFLGLWIGAGGGNAISFFPRIPHMFKRSVKEGGGCFGQGCFENVKDLLIGIVIWLFIFSALGPIGTLIRFLVCNHSIKKLERLLGSGE